MIVAAAVAKRKRATGGRKSAGHATALPNRRGAPAGADAQVLHMCDWTGYIAQSTASGFEARTGMVT